MRLMPLLPFIMSCLCMRLQAQDAEIPVIARSLVPLKGIYRFSSFNEGSIVFRNGIVSGARMNYNISSDEMHFVSQDGDTMSVASPAAVSFINLNGGRFYFDRGFIQQVDSFNGIILGFKQVLIAQQQRKEGYSKVNLNEEIDMYSFFTGNGQKYRLGEGEEIKVYSKEYYFFGAADGRFYKASKDYLYRHYPTHRTAITDFVKKHHTNFNSLEDLLELVKFCRGR
jgi:hypothetical protein